MANNTIASQSLPNTFLLQLGYNTAVQPHMEVSGTYLREVPLLNHNYYRLVLKTGIGFEYLGFRGSLGDDIKFEDNTFANGVPRIGDTIIHEPNGFYWSRDSGRFFKFVDRNARYEHAFLGVLEFALAAQFGSRRNFAVGLSVRATVGDFIKSYEAEETQIVINEPYPDPEVPNDQRWFVYLSSETGIFFGRPQVNLAGASFAASIPIEWNPFPYLKLHGYGSIKGILTEEHKGIGFGGGVGVAYLF